MVSVELLVTLKIPDVTALTAANAVRRRLGYADTLAEMHRADYYCIDVAGDDADTALGLVRQMAERTTLFVNPNKHAFHVRLAPGFSCRNQAKSWTPTFRVSPSCRMAYAVQNAKANFFRIRAS